MLDFAERRAEALSHLSSGVAQQVYAMLFWALLEQVSWEQPAPARDLKVIATTVPSTSSPRSCSHFEIATAKSPHPEEAMQPKGGCAACSAVEESLQAACRERQKAQSRAIEL